MTEQTETITKEQKDAIIGVMEDLVLCLHTAHKGLTMGFDNPVVKATLEDALKKRVEIAVDMLGYESIYELIAIKAIEHAADKQLAS